jgi:hypothetical protein
MVLFSVIEKGEYGLLNPVTRKLHRINETGKFIWEACSEPKNMSELIDLVVRNFQIPRGTAQADLHEFVRHMIAFQLFEEV